MVSVLSIGTLCMNFANEDIAPPDLTTMGLQLNWTLFKDRNFAIEIILHNHVVDHLFAIEVNRYTLTNHDNAELVPFP